jgi:serine/threonine-protein kinase
VLASEPGGPPGATRVDAAAMTLAGLPTPGATTVLREPEHYRDRPRRGALLALAGAVLVAGLAAWLVAAAFASPSAPHVAAGTPTAPSARTVEVNAAALTGQRARLVIQRLRQLGLHPHVVWAADGGQEPGTVISVQPNGQVRPGSIITVTAAFRPPGQRDHHGHGGDGGGGNGQGGGNGGD